MASVQWLSLFQSLSTVIHSCAEYYLRWFLWHVGNTSAVIHQQNNDFISFFISDDIVAFTFMSSFPYLAWLSSTTEQKHSKSQSFNFIKLFKSDFVIRNIKRDDDQESQVNGKSSESSANNFFSTFLSTLNPVPLWNQSLFSKKYSHEEIVDHTKWMIENE